MDLNFAVFVYKLKRLSLNGDFYVKSEQVLLDVFFINGAFCGQNEKSMNKICDEKFFF